MKAMTIEALFELNQKQNELIEKLLIKAESIEKKVENLEKKVELLEREVTKSASPWVRGWKGASEYVGMSVTALRRDVPELFESLTRFKLTDKTFLFKKVELDEFIEGTAVRG